MIYLFDCTFPLNPNLNPKNQLSYKYNGITTNTTINNYDKNNNI